VKTTKNYLKMTYQPSSNGIGNLLPSITMTITTMDAHSLMIGTQTHIREDTKMLFIKRVAGLEGKETTLLILEGSGDAA